MDDKVMARNQMRQMEGLLSDVSTYLVIDKNPINKIFNDLKALLKIWKQYEYISHSSYNHLNSTNAILSRAYNLIKTYKLNFDWFHKSSFSGRYLNYFSCHPVYHKVGTIIGLVGKVFSLSHPSFHSKNFKLIINILLNNDYPINFIFEHIKKRLRNNFHRFNKVDINNDKNEIASENNFVKYFTIPFVPAIADKFKKFFKNNRVIRLAYVGLYKLSKFIRIQKDKLPILSRSSVVYKINCKDCNASYVGQTKRLLKTRISEYRNHINRNADQKLVITKHRLNYNHEFNWNKIEILDEKRVYNRRLISEAICIKKQKMDLTYKATRIYWTPYIMTLYKYTFCFVILGFIYNNNASLVFSRTFCPLSFSFMFYILTPSVHLLTLKNIVCLFSSEFL
ncbi:hypothetical protein ALC57_09445 [Trachymyrmex cornetzi]|uniref:Helix-turn-helix domain-containing protein n=1 Tax=Trachymyrmex cornetzi TaxID=471704 RepID=A0A151J5G9_9HYME|nr:hypothetical protein ALC57_09445 [Trachymyrmex cornetzi]